MNKIVFLFIFIFLTLSNADELNIPNGYEIKNLDPQVAYRMNELLVIDQIYEGLFEYSNENGEIILKPLLAQSLPEVEEIEVKGTKKIRFRIKLKEGVKFHDDPCFPDGKGREVIADDFIYAFKRMADRDVNSPVISQFYSISGFKMFSKIVQKQKEGGRVSSYKLYNSCGEIEGIKKIDKYSFDIVFNTPKMSSFCFLGLKFISAIPHEAVDYYDGRKRITFTKHPVGTGPFTFYKSNESWTEIELLRNENWRSKTSIKKINFKEFKEIDDIKKALKDKRLSIYKTYESVFAKNFINSGYEVNNYLESSLRYLFFNMKDPVFGGDKGIKIRKALSMSLDMTKFRGTKESIAQSPVPPGVVGYNKDYRNPNLKKDIEKAKKLLSEAGYPGGIDPDTAKPLNLRLVTTIRSPEDIKKYQPLKNQWREIGVNLEIDAMSYSEFLESVQKGDFQMAYWGWHADFPDATNFYFLLTSEQKSIVNHSLFENREFDQIFNDMDNFFNRKNKDFSVKDSVRKLNAILEKHSPWIPVDHDLIWIIKDKNLMGYKFNPFNRCYKDLSFKN